MVYVGDIRAQRVAPTMIPFDQRLALAQTMRVVRGLCLCRSFAGEKGIRWLYPRGGPRAGVDAVRICKVCGKPRPTLYVDDMFPCGDWN